MNDLFRAIFGAPHKDQYGKRMDETPPNDYRDNFTRNEGDDMGDNNDDDDLGMNPPGGFFDFSIFNDPFAVHKQFERIVNEMNKAFGVFGFNGDPSITFEDQNRDTSCNEISCQRTENLRDLYLKQPDSGIQNQQSQINFNFGEPGTSSTVSPDGSVTLTKGFSKFIYIQHVQKPDGSVEVIQKVRDHTGNEETTITQCNVNAPVLPPQNNPPTSDNTSVVSLLRKFFPF